MLLDAIEKSDGSRARSVTNVFNTQVTDGLIGSFTINKNGDPSANGPSRSTVTGQEQHPGDDQDDDAAANLVEAARRQAPAS